MLPCAFGELACKTRPEKNQNKNDLVLQVLFDITTITI